MAMYRVTYPLRSDVYLCINKTFLIYSRHFKDTYVHQNDILMQMSKVIYHLHIVVATSKIN